jgi:hypothetical protein
MGMDLTGIGNIADFAKSLVDRFFPPQATAEDKLKAGMELQRMLEERENNLVKAKAAIMTAEMAQEDKFTKRGRPTIIYAGLAFIGINYVFFPILAWTVLMFKDAAIALPQITLPPEFWMAWGGAVSIYILGRSSEKSGAEMGGILGKIYDVMGGKK